MRYRELRRRRRRPRAPMLLLDLHLPFDEVLADLSYPWAEPAAEWAFLKGVVTRAD